MLNFIFRQPFGILGAVSFVALLKGIMTFPQDILFVIYAYEDVTQPVWEFLLGWFFNIVNWQFEGWEKNYLSIGAISTGAATRIGVFSEYTKKEEGDGFWTTMIIYISLPIVVGIFIIIWPLICLMIAMQGVNIVLKKRGFNLVPDLSDLPPAPSHWPSDDELFDEFRVYFEFVFYVLIILAFSYSLRFYESV